ncbi:MAG: alpha/beta fold hydrolase [Alphaproteobacteria bacterium]|nr:MAG: alpha/beta fold hydrolase [Alphaproteobacteria bacterium]
MIFTVFAALFFTASPARAADGNSDYIVLLHGIQRSSKSMEKMATRFSQAGYHVINIDYQSQEYTIDRLADNIYAQIKPFTKNKDYKIHFVGHSMGGLVTRAIIKRHRPENLGRVVMLGTPNQGSEVADFLENNILFQNFYGPAGMQLVTDQRGIANLLGPVDFDLGIIAGTLSIDPLSSAMLPGKDDGKVTVERTKLKGMKDHIVLPTTHTFMMMNNRVIAQTEHFLKHGVFIHSSDMTGVAEKSGFNR